MASDVFEIVGTSVERKYRVDKAIGEGGFGVVYRGHHLGFDAPIAIKCLKMPAHFTAEARAVFYERFREEGKLLLRLSGEHLSIVRVFDFGVATTNAGAQFPFLVLEWLDGRDLQDHLADRAKAGLPPLTEIEALKLLRPAIEALAVAHRAGVAHRDVKPENLFLTRSDARGERGQVLKVLDFGIAKVMQEGESATQLSTNTSSGFRAFSPPHGAPEQFSTKRYGATGPWTDVHALGLILVEMVTGRRALDGEEMVDVLESALSERRPTPRARGAQVSDAFEAMCQRALACTARDRYRSAEDLLVTADAILAAAGEAPASAGSPHVPGALGPNLTVPDARPPGGATVRSDAAPVIGAAQTPVIGAAPAMTPLAPVRPRSRSSGLAIAGVTGLVAILAVGGATAWIAARAKPEGPDAQGSTTATGPVVSVVLSPATPPSRARRMIAVPGATFMMGAAEGSADEKPVHAVTLPGFELDETEVVVADYKACVEAGSCQEPDAGVDCNWGKRDRLEHPVNCVAFRDASAYCSFAKKRLPTEEEWELAARGAAGARYPWGAAEPVRRSTDDATGSSAPQLCWGRRVGEGTCAVASFAAGKTPLGLADMAGNVWEWTSSRFCPYSSKECARESRVVRGGAWLSTTEAAVSGTHRQKEEPTSRSSVVGFRCARGGA